LEFGVRSLELGVRSLESKYLTNSQFPIPNSQIKD
jgi:hypothetical protein